MLVVGAALVAGDLVVVKAAVVVAGLNPRSFTSWPKSNPSFPSAVKIISWFIASWPTKSLGLKI